MALSRYLMALAQTWGKAPVWLVEFSRGEGSAETTWFYHLGNGYTWAGQAYAASPMLFDELSYTSEIRKDDFTLRDFPRADANLAEITGGDPGRLRLVLKRGFHGVDEFVVAWRGTLTATRPRRAAVDLVFGSWSRAAAARSDGFVIQRQCPWRLYGPDCGVVQADHEVAGSASAYADGTVTVAEADAAADGTYSGGLLTFDGDARMIVKHVGPALTLGGAFPALAAAIAGSGPQAVAVAPGCDKSLTTCLARFDNIAANGSFPIMGDNPFFTQVF